MDFIASRKLNALRMPPLSKSLHAFNTIAIKFQLNISLTFFNPSEIQLEGYFLKLQTKLYKGNQNEDPIHIKLKCLTVKNYQKR